MGKRPQANSEWDIKPYTVAVVATVAVALVSFALHGILGDVAAFLPFVGAVVVAAWMGGLRPGLLATVLSAFASVYLFVPPTLSLWITHVSDGVDLGVFLVIGVMVSAICEALHSARRRSETEQRQRAATLESITDGFMRLDRDWRVVYVNAEAERINQRSRSETLGKPFWELWPATIGTTLEAAYRRAVAEQVPVEFENHYEPWDRWFAIKGYPASDGGLALYFRDVTDRKKTDAFLVGQKRVLEKVATDTPLADVLAALCTIIEEQDPRLSCSLLLLDDDRKRIKVGAGPSLSPDYQRFLDGMRIEPPYLGPCGMALHTGEAVVVEDAATDTRWPASWRETVSRHGLRSCRTTPVLAPDGTTLATFAVYRQQPGDPTPSDARIITAAVHLARIAIERKRAEELVRTSEERLRIALNTGKLGSWDLDLATGHLDRSDGCSHNFGLSPDDPLTQDRLFELIHPGDRERVRASVHQAIDTGADYDAEYRTVWPNGETHWISVRGRAIYADGGQPVRMVGVTLDITERKQAEEEARKVQEIFKLVHGIGQIGHWEWNSATDENKWSPEIEALYGLAPGTFGSTYDAWARLVHPDDLPQAAAALERALETGKYFTEFRVIWPDGSIHWLEARAYVFKDDNDKLTRIMGVNMDVTERKRVEEALRESDERFRMLADNIPQLAWIADVHTDGQVNWFNQGWLEYTGTTLEEMKGSGWKAVHHPDYVERVALKFEQHVKQGLEWEDTFPLRRHDGEYRWFLSRTKVIRDDSGTVVRIFGTNTDVTQQRQMADELRRLAAELSEADRRKDEFLATLAHELRNPLAPIRNGLQLIRLANGRADVVEQARAMMERQLTQMVRLVDDLMDVSRITRGKVELRTERMELATAIHDAVEASRPLIDERGHELTVALPDQAIPLDADPTRLAQIFANLMNNAAKYSDRGARIRLTVEPRGSEVVIAVKDTGIGIPPDKLRSVFDLFTQVDRSMEQAKSGLGIGLSLVKGLVEMHGGSVEARSEGPGKGSEFIVRLPTLSAASNEGPVIEEKSGAAAAPRRRILVVDDNHDAAVSLAMMLKIMGNDTRTAHDGLEALDAAAAFRPDVILMDIGMPRLNGYEACRRIREQPGGGNVIVVAQTGWGQDDDKRQSSEAGFDFHMVKPVDPTALEKLLAGLSGVSR